MDSQMRIFFEDFNEERSEKEKQLKENQEIKGENTRLKQKVDKLVTGSSFFFTLHYMMCFYWDTSLHTSSSFFKVFFPYAGV